MRILTTELRRFVWRRSFRLFGAIALAGIALATLIVFLRSDPSSRGVDEPAYRAAVQSCISFHEGDGVEQLPQGESAEDFCAEQIPVQEFDPTFRLISLEDIFAGTSVPLIILGMALGASFIGAEWHSGTITTFLTWEPRRTRVMAGKVMVAMTGVFLSAVALQAILGLVLWPVAALRGSVAGADAAWFADVVAVVARGALIAGLAAAIGFALASAARNTTTALIIGFVYFAVVEGLLRGFRPKWQPWLIGDNAAAFVSGDPASVFSLGNSHGVLAALLVVVAYAFGLVALATFAFRVRDVI
jgi:ABC-type transport system involved in multi-copper enzyme maturation permease subunit